MNISQKNYRGYFPGTPNTKSPFSCQLIFEDQSKIRNQQANPNKPKNMNNYREIKILKKSVSFLSSFL